tara:strand:+ start:148 stop:990 length:843 start_codon:yes stop_codon:yes gene_type:complete
MAIKLPKKVYQDKEKRNKAKKKQTILDLPSIPKLSEYLMQDLFDYKLNKCCGKYISERYINKRVIKLTDNEKLDLFFKEKCADKEPINGVYNKNGKLSLAYDRMVEQSVNFKSFLKQNQWEIEQINFNWTNPKLTSTSDIIALDKSIKSKVVYKKRFIINIITSANIDFEFENGISDELLLKVIHQKMLANFEWGIEDIPFYFLIFSTKNNWEFKALKVNVDASSYKHHYKNLMNAKKYLNDEYILGFKVKSDYKKCNVCALYSTCLDAITTPKIEEQWI